MLNPKLFKRLERRFGEGNVYIANEDTEMGATYLRELVESDGRKVSRTTLSDVLQSGEEYRVSCPFCSDTRHRLYINHRWGVKDDRTGTRNWWLVNCYNAGCVDSWNAQQDLAEQVFNGSLLLLTDDLVKPKAAKAQAPATMPGAVWMLDDMQRSKPWHPAIQYLESRGFDPYYLSTRFGVCYCVESVSHMARGRIIAPVRQLGSLVGWEARFVGEPEKGTPKWFRSKFQSGRTIYNFDNMIRHRTIVLCEGPGDVWRFGVQAGAVFGSRLKPEQAAMLDQHCQPGTTVVVMMDPVFVPPANSRSPESKRHPIERTAALLETYPKFRGRVLKVYLPPPYDPGDLDRWYMRDFIRWRARQDGVEVRFGQSAKVA